MTKLGDGDIIQALQINNHWQHSCMILAVRQVPPFTMQYFLPWKSTIFYVKYNFFCTYRLHKKFKEITVCQLYAYQSVDAKINTLESDGKCSPSHGKSTRRASQFDLKLTREKTKLNSRAYWLGFRISLRWAYRQALPIL